MDDFDIQLDNELEKHLSKIIDRCQVIVEEEIDRCIYSIYDPHQYMRTYQMRNSVRTDVKDGILYVYIDSNLLNYTDFKGNDVSDYVPYWLEYGSNSNQYNRFMLFQHPSRGFIRNSAERIRKEFGIDVEFIEEGYPSF